MRKLLNIFAVVVVLFLSGCTLEDTAGGADTVDYRIAHISGDLTDEDPKTYMISSIHEYVYTMTYYEEAFGVIGTKHELFDLTAFEDTKDFLKIEYNGKITEFEKLSVSVFADIEGRRYDYTETELPDRKEMEENIEKLQSF